MPRSFCCSCCRSVCCTALEDAPVAAVAIIIRKVLGCACNSWESCKGVLPSDVAAVSAPFLGETKIFFGEDTGHKMAVSD